MTTNEILIGLGLIVLLAVGSQVLASRLRIPALIVLLPVGFAGGAPTGDVTPNSCWGLLLQPMVSLAVAVILYDAGLGLELRKLTGHPRRVVWRLIGGSRHPDHDCGRAPAWRWRRRACRSRRR